MNARVNRLLDELGRLQAARQRGEADAAGSTAARISAIEAELEQMNYQFHCVSVSG